jgi:hypothetical protein
MKKYVEFPQIAYIENNDELQLLKLQNNNVIQRIYFPNYFGEIELFLGTDYSLGRTTAGYLIFPSPESNRLEILDDKVSDIKKIGITPGLSIGKYPLYAKIHQKNKIHIRQPIPIIMWTANILEFSEAGVNLHHEL